MRQICSKSGIVLQRDTILDNLGIKPKSLTKLSTHMIFSYDIVELLIMASFKRYESLTTTQRHLIAVALLDQTGMIKIKFPITTDILPPEKLLPIFPLITESCIRIACNRDYWKDMAHNRPKIEIRLDNWEDINIVGFIKKQIYMNTAILLLPRSSSRLVNAKESMLDDEIDFERMLKRKIVEQNANRKTSYYTTRMGKEILRELEKELKQTNKSENKIVKMSSGYKELAMYILAADVDKISPNRATYKDIKKLRDLIDEYVQVSIAPEHTMMRAYVAIVMSNLDKKLAYQLSVAVMFGQMTTTVQAKLNPALPLEYSTQELVKDPFSAGTVNIPPKNSNLESSTNSLVHRIRAKRNGENGGNSGN